MRASSLIKRVIFIGVIALICSEIFANIYLSEVMEKSTRPKFRFNSYRVYEHQPGFREGKHGKDWIVINSNGFRRTKDVSSIKPKNTFRAFLLGGSAAHGISSAPPYPLRHIYPDETIDAYLEKMLSSKYPDCNIEIINAAVTGYRVFSHTQYILSELLNYGPDLIIFFDGANDHYANNPEFDYYQDFQYQFWKTRLQNLSFGGLIDYFIMYLSRYSGLARVYSAWKLQKDAIESERRISINKAYENTNQLISKHKLAAKRQFLRSIEINLLILKNFDIDVIVCLQPMLVLRNKDLLSRQESDFLHKDDRTQILYPIVRNEVTLLTNKYEVQFIDMIPVFNSEIYKNKQLFIDYCHLSPEGSKLAAEALFSKVEESLIKSKITQ